MESELQEGYKMTELGALPEEWKVVELSELVVKTKQFDPRKKGNLLFKYVDISSISRHKLKIESFTEYESKDAPSRARKIIKTNDIIFSTVRPYLKQISLVPENLNEQLCSTGFCVIRCNSDLADYRYIFQCVTTDSFMKKVSIFEVGSNYPAVINSDIFNRLIPLPPLPEQHRIATILSTLDETVEHTEALIEKYKNIKAGLMSDLLTRGIDEEGRIRSEGTHKFKDSVLGRVPEEWEVSLIDEVANVTKLAGFEFTQYFKYRDGGEIIALRALNIKNRKLDLTNVQKIKKEVSEKLPRSQVNAGDILITYIGAYIGDSLLIKESGKYHLAPNVAKITPKSTISADFLDLFLLCGIVKNQYEQLTVLTATPSLTMTQIRKIYVFVPKEKEQHRISEILTAADQRIEKEEAYRDKLLQLKKGLMQDLLTGKVRVKDSSFQMQEQSEN